MGFSARCCWGLGLALLLTGPAWGQPSDAGGEPAPPQPAQTSATPLPPSTPSDSLSPERLMAGPSLHETGRIAVSPVMPTSAIENAQDTPVSPKEKSISHAASTIDVAPVRPFHRHRRLSRRGRPRQADKATAGRRRPDPVAVDDRT
jgi:hypothetical protein